MLINLKGAGVDIKNGRKDVPQNFEISPQNLDLSTTKTVPKFMFNG
jgi:hypothetical protein